MISFIFLRFYVVLLSPPSLYMCYGRMCVTQWTLVRVVKLQSVNEEKGNFTFFLMSFPPFSSPSGWFFHFTHVINFCVC